MSEVGREQAREEPGITGVLSSELHKVKDVVTEAIFGKAEPAEESTSSSLLETIEKKAKEVIFGSEEEEKKEEKKPTEEAAATLPRPLNPVSKPAKVSLPPSTKDEGIGKISSSQQQAAATQPAQKGKQKTQQPPTAPAATPAAPPSSTSAKEQEPLLSPERVARLKKLEKTLEVMKDHIPEGIRAHYEGTRDEPKFDEGNVPPPTLNRTEEPHEKAKGKAEKQPKKVPGRAKKAGKMRISQAEHPHIAPPPAESKKQLQHRLGRHEEEPSNKEKEAAPAKLEVPKRGAQPLTEVTPREERESAEAGMQLVEDLRTRQSGTLIVPAKQEIIHHEEEKKEYLIRKSVRGHESKVYPSTYYPPEKKFGGRAKESMPDIQRNEWSFGVHQ